MAHIPFLARVSQECIRLRNLPLLSSIVQSVANEKPLQTFTVLNIQHQLGDVTTQIESLLVLGVSPLDIYFFPPPYTHNKEFELFVMENYQIPKENLFQPSSYRLRYDYGRYRLLHVMLILFDMMKMELMKQRPNRNNLLVLDDGGCFSEAIAALYDIDDRQLDPIELAENLPSTLALSQSDAKSLISYLRSIDIRLVEQTSRGIFKYLDQPKITLGLAYFNISIIDVATSEPKRRLESPIIAEACLNVLSYLFHDSPNHLRIPKPTDQQQCLLLGYGAIGTTIAHALTHAGELGMFQKTSVKVYDRDINRCKSAENDGFEIFDGWDQKEEFDYIIGCVGRCSLPISSFSILRNNAHLISVSSATVEFPIHEMIECALTKSTDVPRCMSLSNEQLAELDNEDIHRNIVFQLNDGRHITVVNGGMPITFIGLVNPTTPEKFDVTMSCVISAAIQAVRSKENTNQSDRIIPLDKVSSKMICSWFDTPNALVLSRK